MCLRIWIMIRVMCVGSTYWSVFGSNICRVCSYKYVVMQVWGILFHANWCICIWRRWEVYTLIKHPKIIYAPFYFFHHFQVKHRHFCISVPFLPTCMFHQFLGWSSFSQSSFRKKVQYFIETHNVLKNALIWIETRCKAPQSSVTDTRPCSGPLSVLSLSFILSFFLSPSVFHTQHYSKSTAPAQQSSVHAMVRYV